MKFINSQNLHVFLNYLQLKILLPHFSFYCNLLFLKNDIVHQEWTCENFLNNVYQFVTLEIDFSAKDSIHLKIRQITEEQRYLICSISILSNLLTPYRVIEWVYL